MTDSISVEQTWIIIVGIVGTTIVGSILLSGMFDLIKTAYEARLDKRFPQRLERFKTEAYAEGVRDATPKTNVTVQK